MRILLISPYFPPQHAVASMRTHSFARWWSKAGSAVTVLTTKKRDDQRGLELPCDGFTVVELPYRGSVVTESLRRRHRPDAAPGRTGRPGMAKRFRDRRGVFCSVRMPDLTDRWVKPALRWAAAHGPWDVLVSSSGPYTAHVVALHLHQQRHAHAWVADFRDLWVDHPAYRGVFPYTFCERMLQRRCLHSANLVVTVSEGLARTLEPQSRAPVEIIYNGCEIDAIQGVPPARILPEDGLAHLVYTGMVYPPGQDPSPLFRAMAWLREQRPGVADQLRLDVAGRECNTWTHRAESFGVAGMITSHGLLDHDDALRMQRDATALLVVDWNDPDRGVLTAKLLEYAHMPPPVLAIGPHRDSPIGRFLVDAGRGVHLGDEPEQIAARLADVVTNPAAFHCERNAPLLATFTREHQAMRLLERIRTLTESA